MIKRILLASALTGTALFAAPAAAWEIGARAGVVDYDLDISVPTAAGDTDIDYGTAVSGRFSYDLLELLVADLLIEGEYTTTVSDNEIEYNTSLGTATGESDFESLGGYVRAVTSGPIYAFGRVGYTSSSFEYDLSLNNTSFYSEKNTETGPSAGIGVGFGAGLTLELEYTYYDVGDNDVQYVTLGAAF